MDRGKTGQPGKAVQRRPARNEQIQKLCPVRKAVDRAPGVGLRGPVPGRCGEERDQHPQREQPDMGLRPERKGSADKGHEASGRGAGILRDGDKQIPRRDIYRRQPGDGVQQPEGRRDPEHAGLREVEILGP